MRAQRIDLMEKYIIQEKSVTLDQLCEKFQVSKNTIRRDVNTLIRQGNFQKVYGGIMVNEAGRSNSALIPYETRHTTLTREKDRICALAASYVQDGDFIYIDTGTTCLNMVDYLRDCHCTILTNSLQVCMKAVPYPGLEVISMPGRLKRETLSYVGNDITDYLKTYNIRKAFMACSGITIENGLTNSTMEEYTVKKTVIENSSSVFILADHTKFDKCTLMTFCPLSRVNQIITDAPVKNKYQQFCISHHIDLCVAK